MHSSDTLLRKDIQGSKPNHHHRRVHNVKVNLLGEEIHVLPDQQMLTQHDNKSVFTKCHQS